MTRIEMRARETALGGPFFRDFTFRHHAGHLTAMLDSIPLKRAICPAISSERCPSCRRNAVRHYSGITVRHGPERAQ
jgi:hypothetical protein